VSPADDTNAKFTAGYMVRQLAAKRITIVHDTRVYGKGLADLTRANLEELGTPAALVEAVEPGQLVFTGLIERARRANSDMLYYAGYPREIGLLRRQMAEAGFLPPAILSGAVTSQEYVMIAGPAAEGTLVVADRSFDTVELSQFAAKLREASLGEADLRSTRGYSSVKVWAQAVEAAGTTDGTAVAQALHSGTFHVLGVEARFDTEGNAQGPLGEAALWVWRNGRPVPLKSDLHGGGKDGL
jgi:branched-chain amino acid transport system substrate-binding protein